MPLPRAKKAGNELLGQKIEEVTRLSVTGAINLER
jgi:hypothetical protein